MSGTVNSFGRLALTLLVLVFLFGCSESAKDSDECYYEVIDTEAEVINLKAHPEGEGRIAVILDFKASSLALEDQELGALKDVKIDHDFIERNNIEIGNRYSVNVSELTKGDCTPQFVSFNHSLE